jgi:hypothetical protein
VNKRPIRVLKTGIVHGFGALSSLEGSTSDEGWIFAARERLRIPALCRCRSPQIRQ